MLFIIRHFLQLMTLNRCRLLLKLGKFSVLDFYLMPTFIDFQHFQKDFSMSTIIWNPDSYYNWLWWLWFGRLFWIFYIFCYFSFEIVHKHIQISPLIQWSCDFIMEYKWLSMPLVSKLTIIIYLDIYSMNWVYPKSWHLL